MFSQIQATNFRGFTNVTISSLKRVNVFTGMNGCGKTSVLEIPFLLAGGPNANLVLSLYNFRNERQLAPYFERPFASLFNELKLSRHIEIEAYGDFKSESENAYRKLIISPEFSTDVEPKGTNGNGAERISGLRFHFQGPNGESTGKIAWVTETESIDEDSLSQPKTKLKINIPPGEQDRIPGYFITPYYREVWQQAHKILTQLTKQNRVREIVNQLTMIEPNLINLLPLSESGILIIYADIGLENLIPVPLLGGGFANIFHIVLDASVAHDGVLIIDEIEDGIHNSVLPELITYLFNASLRNNLQLFISTHSDEILATFAKVASDIDFKDLGLFRLRKEDGQGIVSYFSLEDLVASRETNADLR